MNRPKVALIAVASNETAYIASFIFHHLSLGFDPIAIVVNRSQDGTEEIVRRIASRFASVHLIMGDELLKTTRVRLYQKEAYLYAIEWLKRKIRPRDYVCLLDVDEYWVPNNSAVDISSYLAGYNYPAMASFNWFAPSGDVQPFHLPFQFPHQGIMLSLVKSAWRASLKDNRINPHVLYFTKGRKITASGVEFDSKDACKTAVRPSAPGTAYVIHQLDRSLLEYVAVLGRGNPDDDSMFKLNRHGYRAYFSGASLLQLSLPPQFGLSWRDEYAVFVRRTGVLPLILQGRQLTVRRAAETITKFQALSESEKQTYEVPFRGVDASVVDIQLRAAQRSGALDHLFPSYEVQGDVTGNSWASWWKWPYRRSSAA